MEHRYSVRLPVAMNVLLYHNNVPVVHCKTENIGADGMFVSTGDLKYGTNSILKVEFVAGAGQDARSHMIPAMVVHHNNHGMGLMFPRGDTKAMQVWRNFIRRSVLENSINQINNIIKQNGNDPSGFGGGYVSDVKAKLSVA